MSEKSTLLTLALFYLPCALIGAADRLQESPSQPRQPSQPRGCSPARSRCWCWASCSWVSDRHLLGHLLPRALAGPARASDDNPITRRFSCQPSSGCCDQHEWCRFWASMGECRSNRNWMERNCQLACSSCRKGEQQGGGQPSS